MTGGIFITGQESACLPALDAALEDPQVGEARVSGPRGLAHLAAGGKGRIRGPTEKAPAAPGSQHHSLAGGFLYFDSEAIRLSN